MPRRSARKNKHPYLKPKQTEQLLARMSGLEQPAEPTKEKS